MTTQGPAMGWLNQEICRYFDAYSQGKSQVSLLKNGLSKTAGGFTGKGGFISRTADTAHLTIRIVLTYECLNI